MKELLRKIKTRIGPMHRGRIFYVALVAVGIFLITGSSHELITGQREDAAASDEYEDLRAQFSASDIHAFLADAGFLLPDPDFAPASPANDESQTPSPGVILPPRFDLHPTDDADSSEFRIPNSELDESEEPRSLRPLYQPQSDPLAAMARVNPDFIGWIFIEGVLDYPVVRGTCNEYYLDVTFRGQQNPSGAIFMDYRNALGFHEPVTMLYGHNMRNGTMFARLHRYLDRSFMADNPHLMIVTSDWEVLLYRVFSARIINSEISAYGLSDPTSPAAVQAFRRAPEGAQRFLIMSTCTNTEDENERLHVYAALVS